MVSIVSRMLCSPSLSCLIIWAVVFAGFYLGPFEFSPAPSASTIALFLGCILLFTFASLAGGMLARDRIERSPPSPRATVCVFPLDSIVSTISIASLAGCICIVVDRLASTGFDGLAGFTELRYARAEELLAADDISRGKLTYLGYVLYPGLYLVCAIGVLFYEALSRRARILLYLNALGPFVLAVFFGGRSPILVLFLLVSTACLTRRLLGMTLVPKGSGLKLLVAVGLVVFIAYTNFIWFERLELSASSVDLALDHAANVWGIEPSESLEGALGESGREDLLLPLLGAYFYMFEGPSIFERLMLTDSAPVMFGGYHVDIIAAAYRLFGPSRDMLANGYGILLDAGVYGFWPTAWGALLIDLSIAALPFIAIWGWVTGATHKRLCLRPRASDAVFFVFALYTVVISPISAPLGLANSFSIFLYFLGFKTWASLRYERNSASST